MNDSISTRSEEWIREQWSNPQDIFTLLMILGGDVVRVAMAQLCCGPVPGVTPVAFSFGWVSYAISAAANKRLMPKPDSDCLVINAKNGYARGNSSWVLARVLRDFHHWKDARCDEAEADMLRTAKLGLAAGHKPLQIGLRISVWKQRTRGRTGDAIYWVGFVVMLAQMAIAAAHWALFGQWLTFAVTGMGTLLSLASGALPQWREEKLGVRTLESRKSVFLTEGNGAHEVLLILSELGGLNLEDLGSPFRRLRATAVTQAANVFLAVAWMALLISVAGWADRTWFLVTIGLLGMAHNLLVTAVPRAPKAYGIGLEYVDTFVDVKVMRALWKVENEYPCAGKALLGVFFPGGLRANEIQKWEFADQRYQMLKSWGMGSRGKALLLPGWEEPMPWSLPNQAQAAQAAVQPVLPSVPFVAQGAGQPLVNVPGAQRP